MSIFDRIRLTLESAAEYPTPPSYEPVGSRVRVEVDGVVIAETRRAVVVRQTGIPPVYYIPPEDIRTEHLVPSDRTSHCPYKGDAVYFALEVNGRRIGNAAWSYPNPLPEAGSIAGQIAFYAHAVDATVDGVPARAPRWKYIGGWVTPNVTGPFQTRGAPHGAD